MSRQKKFAFYGRTRRPLPARSVEATDKRTRQLSIAKDLVTSANGNIMLSFFDTKSDRLATWSHRQQARRLLGALTAPDRMFDAIVVGDTRITMSASQFDDVVRLCLFHGVELWCPEIGYAYEHGNVHHAAIMWQLFWGRHDPLLPRQRSAGAPLPVGDPPNS